MRLVTRCPACATTFKVVRDQLRISDGWVRCGRCSEVFDATQDLQETDDDGVPLRPASVEPAAPAVPVAPAPSYGPPQENLLPPAPAPAAAMPAMDWPSAELLDLGGRPPAPAPQHTSSASTQDRGFEDSAPPGFEDDEDDSQEPWLDDMLASTQALQAALQSASLASAGPGHALPDAQRKEPGFASPALTTPSLSAPSPAESSPIEQAVNNQLQKALRRERIKALRRERAEQKEHERNSETVATPEAPVGEPISESASAADPAEATTLLLEAPTPVASFIGETAAAPASTSRARRVLLALCCLLALVVLLLQVAREERDTLVAREPRLRPALQLLCQWSGCELSALRQIGAITIEGASFSREKDSDGYRLVFSLRNGARVPLAMPSIELTLLDTQERALVRRVLSPAQFGAAAVLGPGAESNTSLPLALSGREAQGLSSVAGYNLIAFYP